MSKLNVQTADLLCTAVTVGFIKRAIVDPKTPKTMLVYENPSDKTIHDAIAKKLNAIYGDGKIQITQAVTQKQLPFIAAKKNGMTSDELKHHNDSITTLVNLLHKTANEVRPPYGAYIGGLFNVVTKKIQFLGPSTLAIYGPKFRDITPDKQSEITKSYRNAAKATNDALACIGVVSDKFKSLNHTMPMTYKNAKQEPSEIANGKLFTSYHGMIQVIMKFGPHITKEQFGVELALGNNTTKIASCVPCSMFMEAADMPATTTHLGRGDNWGIPTYSESNTGNYVSQWEKNIIIDFKTGMEIIKKHNPGIDFNQIPTENLPKLFLEALTFEKSFTARIAESLKI